MTRKLRSADFSHKMGLKLNFENLQKEKEMVDSGYRKKVKSLWQIVISSSKVT